MVALSGPGPAGWNRMTTSIDDPGLTASGYEDTLATTEVPPEVDTMSEISSMANPELLIVRTWSTGVAGHVSPNEPPGVMVATTSAAGARAASSRLPLMLPHPVPGSQPQPAV